MELRHKEILHKSFLFRDVNNADYSKLVNCLSPQIKSFSKNEIMLLIGDTVHHIGIILTGNACAYLEYANGSQTLISNLKSMSVFGEILVSTRSHRSPVTVYAMSDVTVAFIEYEKIHSICASVCEGHRVFLQNLLKAIGDKYFVLFDRINILCEKSLRSRIIAYLYSLSGRGEMTTVIIPFTKTMLAEYLLINRSALSRELRKMEDDGIISVHGREIKIHFFGDVLN